MTPEIDHLLSEIQDLSPRERMIFEGYMVGSIPDQVRKCLNQIKDDRVRINRNKSDKPEG